MYDHPWDIASCLDLNSFGRLLGSASARVDAQYFTLTTSDHVEPISRERVYCYELYHQLRVAWSDHVAARECPSDLASFTLNGEVDKVGHSAFAGALRGIKPDFIVHVPGRMDMNLLAIEVKRGSERRETFWSDLAKLRLMVTQAQYRRGILLIFGESYCLPGIESGMDSTLADMLRRSELQVWHHRSPGEQAIPVLGRI